jgi:DNA-binding MarR family transcriptional regulator
MKSREPGTRRKQTGVSELKAHIGFWMRLVSNHVSHTFARRLKASGVTVAEWVILREMFEGNAVTSPSDVAELTGLTRGAVSKLVERLLKKELVTRQTAAGDRRYQDIKLTPAAAALVPRLGRLADENDETFFGVLAEAERDALRQTLVRIADLHSITHPPIE